MDISLWHLLGHGVSLSVLAKIGKVYWDLRKEHKAHKENHDEVIKLHEKILAEKEKDINELKANLSETDTELKEALQKLLEAEERINEFERFYNEDVTKMATEAGKKIEAWENFFNDTLEDVQSIVEMLDKLMNHRQMISDDPDVQNLYKVIVILRDILTGYIDAKNEKQKDSTGSDGSGGEEGKLL
jgi:chromosome segregation ATPase